MKITEVKCTNCKMIYGACLDNDYHTIECPQCKNGNYSIIDSNYRGPWKEEGCIHLNVQL